MAILVALLASTVFLGVAALGVDTARWYVEVERLQKAADAAALSGVTYMPNDLTSARSTAVLTAAKNGFPVDTDTTVTVAQGERPSQLKVTISSRVDNALGGFLGLTSSVMTRSSVADYTAPAPMGSPCNTFGNEPPSSGTAPTPYDTALPPAGVRFANCTPTPQFWAAAEGPETDKLQGDRYNTRKCTEDSPLNNNSTYSCTSGSNGINQEFRPDGYYFAVYVEQAAVGTEIDVQVYDPAFVNTGVYCSASTGTPSANNPVMPANPISNMNPYTTDGTARYGRGNDAGTGPGQAFCSGDTFPGASIKNRMTTTTYVMRGTTETDNPLEAQPLSACSAKQFRGYDRPPTFNALRSTNGAYNRGLAEVWHQWYSMCKFTPTKAGNYFLQVRTNVALGGSPEANTNSNNPVVYTGNPAATAPVGNSIEGAGANSFTLRAVPASSSLRDNVSVSGWERMPVLQIAPGSVATFNLVRALPNAGGQYLTFDFFDAADGASGSVKVLPPADATGSVKAGTGIPGCRAGLNDASPSTYTTLTGCSVNVNGSFTDGQVMHMVIPLPNDYSCDNSTLGGCWFRVQLDYSGGGSGAKVTDLTTWSANIGGDPVRLIE